MKDKLRTKNLKNWIHEINGVLNGKNDTSESISHQYFISDFVRWDVSSNSMDDTKIDNLINDHNSWVRYLTLNDLNQIATWNNLSKERYIQVCNVIGNNGRYSLATEKKDADKFSGILNSIVNYQNLDKDTSYALFSAINKLDANIRYVSKDIRSVFSKHKEIAQSKHICPIEFFICSDMGSWYYSLIEKAKSNLLSVNSGGEYKKRLSYFTGEFVNVCNKLIKDNNKDIVLFNINQYISFLRNIEWVKSFNALSLDVRKDFFWNIKKYIFGSEIIDFERDYSKWYPSSVWNFSCVLSIAENIFKDVDNFSDSDKKEIWIEELNKFLISEFYNEDKLVFEWNLLGASDKLKLCQSVMFNLINKDDINKSESQAIVTINRFIWDLLTTDSSKLNNEEKDNLSVLTNKAMKLWVLLPWDRVLGWLAKKWYDISSVFSNTLLKSIHISTFDIKNVAPVDLYLKDVINNTYNKNIDIFNKSEADGYISTYNRRIDYSFSLKDWFTINKNQIDWLNKDVKFHYSGHINATYLLNVFCDNDITLSVDEVSKFIKLLKLEGAYVFSNFKFIEKCLFVWVDVNEFKYTDLAEKNENTKFAIIESIYNKLKNTDWDIWSKDNGTIIVAWAKNNENSLDKLNKVVLGKWISSGSNNWVIELSEEEKTLNEMRLHFKVTDKERIVKYFSFWSSVSDKWKKLLWDPGIYSEFLMALRDNDILRGHFINWAVRRWNLTDPLVRWKLPNWQKRYDLVVQWFSGKKFTLKRALSFSQVKKIRIPLDLVDFENISMEDLDYVGNIDLAKENENNNFWFNAVVRLINTSLFWGNNNRTFVWPITNIKKAFYDKNGNLNDLFWYTLQTGEKIHNPISLYTELYAWMIQTARDEIAVWNFYDLKVISNIIRETLNQYPNAWEGSNTFRNNNTLIEDIYDDYDNKVKVNISIKPVIDIINYVAKNWDIDSLNVDLSNVVVNDLVGDYFSENILKNYEFLNIPSKASILRDYLGAIESSIRLKREDDEALWYDNILLSVKSRELIDRLLKDKDMRSYLWVENRNLTDVFKIHFATVTKFYSSTLASKVNTASFISISGEYVWSSSKEGDKDYDDVIKMHNKLFWTIWYIRNFDISVKKYIFNSFFTDINFNNEWLKKNFHIWLYGVLWLSIWDLSEEWQSYFKSISTDIIKSAVERFVNKVNSSSLGSTAKENDLELRNLQEAIKLYPESDIKWLTEIIDTLVIPVLNESSIGSVWIFNILKWAISIESIKMILNKKK